jgi:hypothetical protein
MEEKFSDALEQIAKSWDGCMYDAPGETMDIGASLRRQFKQLGSFSAQAAPQAYPAAELAPATPVYKAADLKAAPDAVRDAALEEAISVCEAEAIPNDPHASMGEDDAAYNLAIEHCAAAIRSLRYASTPAPAGAVRYAAPDSLQDGCPACPTEVRDLFAVAHNITVRMPNIAEGDLKRAVQNMQPLIDRHFANPDHSHPRGQKAPAPDRAATPEAAHLTTSPTPADDSQKGDNHA